SEILGSARGLDYSRFVRGTSINLRYSTLCQSIRQPTCQEISGGCSERLHRKMAAVIFMFTATILTTAAASPLALTLERAFPSNHGIDLDQLQARDTSQHGRILKSSDAVVAFHVYVSD
ncbi:hypothetical protein L195_g049086, partial [Trifolium pratense]